MICPQSEEVSNHVVGWTVVKSEMFLSNNVRDKEEAYIMAGAFSDSFSRGIALCLIVLVEDSILSSTVYS
jgi:hypothetical protein